MPFKWTAGRLARTASAVRAYNAAITRKARELVKQGLDHLVEYLPSRITTASVRERVHSVNDFRRIVGYANDLRNGRTSELTRILRTANPHALDFTESEEGTVTTVYAKNQRRYDRQAIERVRRMTEDAVTDGKGLSDLPPEVKGTLTTNNDSIPPDAGERDESYDRAIDPDELSRWRDEDAREKRSAVQLPAIVDTYYAVWKDPLNHHSMLPGYGEFNDAMDWLMANRPQALTRAFALAPDELDPWFIVDSGGTRNPYINIPFETRHTRAVNYIVGLAQDNGWEGDDGLLV